MTPESPLFGPYDVPEICRSPTDDSRVRAIPSRCCAAVRFKGILKMDPCLDAIDTRGWNLAVYAVRHNLLKEVRDVQQVSQREQLGFARYELEKVSMPLDMSCVVNL